MSYDPIPHLVETVGHLEARRTEIADRLASAAAPYYDQVLDLPDEPEREPDQLEAIDSDDPGISLPL